MRGVVALTVTPFKDDGSLDLEGLRRNVEFLMEGGADVVVVNGSCGECYAMSVEEQKRVIEAAVDAANGRVPVVAGASHSGTGIAVELARHAQDVGADGVQVIPPYYYAGDVVAHYLEVARSIDIGVIVYDNPEVIGRPLGLNTLSKIIGEADNVVGVKDCTEDLIAAAEAVRALGDRVALLCGTGEALAPFYFMLGSPGTYSSIANFAPQIPAEMYRAAQRSDYKRVVEIHGRLVPLIKFIREHGPFIRVIKGAMELAGRPAGPVRLPLTPLTSAEREELKEILGELGVIGGESG